MTKPTVDELLRASAPRDVYDEPGMRERVAAAVAQRPKKRRRAWVVLPIAVFGVAALTAGAVVVDNVMTLDVSIDLSYVTDTGNVEECFVNVGGATLLDPKGRQIADWFRDHNWEGIGQKVYARALEIDPTKGLENSAEYSQRELDASAWSDALSELVVRSVPVEVTGPEASVGAQWDCDGLLH